MAGMKVWQHGWSVISRARGDCKTDGTEEGGGELCAVGLAA